MKKLIIAPLCYISIAFIFGTLCVYATPNYPPLPKVAEIIPIACPCESCDTMPVFNSCQEIDEWRIRYFEKRAKLYTDLCLAQEQRIRAKCIDEKFFDEIAPLKMCLQQEEKKLNEMKCKKECKKYRKEQKEKIKDLKNEIKDKKKQHEKAFRDILSCEQKTYYEKLEKEIRKNKCRCN